MKIMEKFEQYFENIENIKKETPIYRTLLKDQALKEFSKEDKTFGFVVSDSVSTKGVKTTANSKILEDYVPDFDAKVVENLKEAGGVLLGKTITLEFGVGERETIFGTNLAVVNGEDIIGLTIDSKGFMHLGANEYGLYGYTPTFGLVSRYGLITVSSSIDRMGIVAKEFENIQKAASIIIEKDPRDSLSLSYDEDLSNLPHISFENLTCFTIDKFKHFSKEIRELSELGMTLQEEKIEELEYSIPTYEILSSAEFATNMEKYNGVNLGTRSENYIDLIDLYKNSRSQGLGKGVQEKIIFGNFCLSEDNYRQYYLQGLRSRTMIKSSLEKLLGVDEFLIAPISLYYTSAINLSGLPAISIPYGEDGILIASKAFNDKRLLGFAKELSRVLEGRK